MRPPNTVIYPPEIPTPTDTRVQWTRHLGKPLGEAEALNLRLLSAGLTNDQIARRRGVSEKTVKAQLQSARAKLGARNAPHAVALWLREEATA